jgi:hypothetical protein
MEGRSRALWSIRRAEQARETTARPNHLDKAKALIADPNQVAPTIA